MKYNYKRTRIPAKIFALMMLMALWLPSNAQVLVPFAQRTSTYTPTTKIYNIKGDFQMIGNTNMTLQSYSDNGNNSSNMIYVDVDGLPNTLNSSSATLAFPIENGMIPECSNIIYAGLYWIGRAHDGTSANTFSVTKSVPGAGSPTTVNSTSSVSNNGSITYTTYTMVVTRRGTTNNYYPRYSFSSTTPGQPTVLFEFLNPSTSGTIRYSTDGGATFTNITGVTYQENTPNNSSTTATFAPITISTESGGITLTVDRLVRNEGSNATTETTQNGASARVTVTGTYYAPANVTKNFDKSVVYLKHSSESGYETISAQDINFSQNIYYPTTNYGYMYSAYAEVTDYVKTHGLGAYTVADIALREGDGGATGFFGGWGMIVVYENSKMKWRDVTIFDGHAYVQGGAANFELPVSGFRTAQHGDISMKLGLIAGEGDRSISGDYFQILPHGKLSLPTPAETDWVYLSHTGNSTTNFFNSSIPAPAPRNPTILNNTGVDIAMFNINNTGNTIITNNQISTRFRYGSTQDTYIIPVVAMAVDAYIPDLHANLSVTSLNGAPFGPTNSKVLPGQEMEYKLDLTNPSEPITNAKIVIPIPYTAKYVSSSAVYFQGTGGTNPVQPQYVTSGASKFIEWYIGNIPTGTPLNNLLASMTFKLEATDDCFLLVNENCSPKVLVEGAGSGTGVISGTPFTNMRFIRGYRDGICQDEPILGPLSVDIDATEYVLANCAEEAASGGYKYLNSVRIRQPHLLHLIR